MLSFINDILLYISDYRDISLGKYCPVLLGIGQEISSVCNCYWYAQLTCGGSEDVFI